MYFIRETSERSDNKNTLKKAILKNSNFKLISFEGSPTINDNVTILMDKFKVDIDLSTTNKNDKIKIFNELYRNSEFKDEFALKKTIVENRKLKWGILVYDDNEYSLFFLKDGKEGRSFYKEFQNAKEFSNWLYENYSTIRYNISNYQEDNLPKYDISMRKNGKPWPGNVDGILLHNKKMIAVIEFQTTNKQSVREHNNNDWWLPKYSRKGDKERWRSIYINSNYLNLPIIVGVWNPKEEEYCIKLIKGFNFETDKPPFIFLKKKEIADDKNISIKLLEVLNINEKI
ncbi:hypothetical protein ACO1GZ_03470 [Fusobacterium watanabei]|uniref:hypothetical protein n=1 Tax=Fusobacterium watanabei TaxID=2686067 RepID=UPI003B587F53